MPGSAGSWRWPALDRALAFLKDVEPDLGAGHRVRIDELLDILGNGAMDTAKNAAAPATDRHELTARIAAIVSVLRSERLL